MNVQIKPDCDSESFAGRRGTLVEIMNEHWLRVQIADFPWLQPTPFRWEEVDLV